MPVLLVLAVFLTATVFPFLGMVMGLVSPAPLIYIYLQRGRTVGLAAIGIVSFMILLLLGLKSATVFFAEYAVLAMIMAETIRLRQPIGNSILLSALGSAFVSGLCLFIFFSSNGKPPEEMFQEHLKENLEQSLTALKGMGKSQAELDSVRAVADQMVKILAASFPAFLVVGSLICAVVNFNLIRFLQARSGLAALELMGRFSEWVLPDQLVWLFIFSAGSFFLPDEGFRVVGLNVFMVMLGIYFFQGLAIVTHFLESKAAPVFLWLIVFVLVFTQPVVMGVVAGLGLFDLWVDFRKFKTDKSGQDADGDDEE